MWQDKIPHSILKRPNRFPHIVTRTATEALNPLLMLIGHNLRSVCLLKPMRHDGRADSVE
jgi:hypothetical protein